MRSKTEELAKKIEELPDTEKALLVDMILAKLDQPDMELDKVWADEAAKRWAAYKEGRLKTLPYDEVMARYRQRREFASLNFGVQAETAILSHDPTLFLTPQTAK